QVTVTVGSATYQSASLRGPAAPGFFVAILDAGSLALRESGTFTSGTAPSGEVGSLAAMHTLLSTYASDPSALAIVQWIGPVGRPPAANAAAWNDVAGDLEAFGGSHYYFDALNGTSSAVYTQVGPGGGSGTYPATSTQVSTSDRDGVATGAANASVGRLTGLLARNDTTQFSPGESTAPGTPITGTLSGLISTPPTAWPLRHRPAQKAAL